MQRATLEIIWKFELKPVGVIEANCVGRYWRILVQNNYTGLVNFLRSAQ